MAIAWTDVINGESLLSIREKVNAFGGAVKTQVNNNINEIASLGTRVTTIETNNYTDFTPQVTPPTYQEGRVYYDQNNGALMVEGPIEDADIAVGHTMHIHVVNNSGATIEKGMAVRHDGVLNGQVQIVKAIATSFTNARIFGVTQQDIPNGSVGTITTFGEINSVNTSGVTAGVPLYLSDTVAGTYTTTAPDIVSRVGGALTSAIDGKLFVSIINNIQLPNIIAALRNQTAGNETYSVTTTYQDIINYDSKAEVVLNGVLLTGKISTLNPGFYRAGVSASISFSSLASTRSITVELYNVTDAISEYAYTKNIPRDSTDDSFSFNFPFASAGNKEYVLRIKGSTAIDVTFSALSFDIESVNIK